MTIVTLLAGLILFTGCNFEYMPTVEIFDEPELPALETGYASQEEIVPTDYIYIIGRHMNPDLVALREGDNYAGWTLGGIEYVQPMYRDGIFLRYYAVDAQFYGIQEAQGKLETDGDGNIVFRMDWGRGFPVLFHIAHKPTHRPPLSFTVRNHEEAAAWLSEGITVMVRDFHLNTITGNTAEIVGIIEYAAADYIYMTSADGCEGTHMLMPGDSFLGLTLEEGGSYNRYRSGEFAWHIEVFAHFSGELTVTGDLTLMLYETQSGPAWNSFVVNDRDTRQFPIFYNHNWPECGPRIWLHIANEEDLIDMLGIDLNEHMGTRVEFENIAMRVKDYSTGIYYRAFNRATIVEILD